MSMMLVAAAGGPKMPYVQVVNARQTNGFLTVPKFPPQVKGPFARVQDKDALTLLRALLKGGKEHVVMFETDYPELTHRGLACAGKIRLTTGQLFAVSGEHQEVKKKGNNTKSVVVVPDWEPFDLSGFALAVEKKTKLLLLMDKDAIRDDLPVVGKSDLT